MSRFEQSGQPRVHICASVLCKCVTVCVCYVTLGDTRTWGDVLLSGRRTGDGWGAEEAAGAWRERLPFHNNVVCNLLLILYHMPLLCF